MTTNELLESMMKNKVIKLNYNTWSKSKGNNILYVTGLSGAGKSTYSKALAKQKNATYVGLDHVHFYHESSGGLVSSSKYGSIKNISKLKWRILNEMKKDVNHLYIVEGIQIYTDLKLNFLKTKPFIIIDTNKFVAMYRRQIREAKKFNKKINWISYLKLDFPVIYKEYADHDNYLKHVKKTIKKDSHTSKEEINEGFSKNLYHKTSFRNTFNILRDNQFWLTDKEISGDVGHNEKYYMSFTRDPLKYYANKGVNVILEIDGEKLKKAHKGINYNFNYSNDKATGQYARSKNRDEAEERLVSNKEKIKPVNKFIKSITYVVGNNESNSNIKELKKMASLYNIPVKAFNRGRDNKYHTSKMNLKIQAK